MSVEKFGRNYTLTLDGFGDQAIVIKPPFTIEFEVQRTVQSTINVVNLRIYNLNQKTREILRKDAFARDDIRALIFQVGYGEQLYTVAAGSVRSASSVRQGTDFITTIVAQDGGQAFKSARTNATAISGVSKLTVVENLIRALKPFGIERGVVGKVEGSFKRSVALNGSVIDNLNEITNEGFYIDNGRAYVVAEDEAIGADIITISSANGLMNTPTREQAYTKVSTLFSPEIQLNQVVNLVSSEKTFTVNSAKVYAISHSGIISESVGGSAKTDLTLLDGNYTRIRRIEGGS